MVLARLQCTMQLALMLDPLYLTNVQTKLFVLKGIKLPQ